MLLYDLTRPEVIESVDIEGDILHVSADGSRVITYVGEANWLSGETGGCIQIWDIPASPN